MSLLPTPFERLARARADLRIGLPVELRGAGTRLLAASAESVSAERLSGLMALGPAVVAVTARRAETLKARAYDGDLARLRLPADASEALVAALADPARDLSHPMKGPFNEERGTDASLHRAAIRLAKSARLLPAVVAVTPPADARYPELTWLDAADVAAEGDLAPVMSELASARLPMAVSQAGRLHVFRPADGSEEHSAVEIGRPDRDGAPLVRLHSACFTGDVLGSLKCDCGPQLHAALERMAAEGAGVLLYLSQEGRGIGLTNKLRAYSLQDQGFDTVEANHRLGFEDDERDFRIGAELLRKLGFSRVRLLTNNPAKVAMLEDCGIEVVERVPLKAGHGPLNRAYLATKAKKSGHLL
ncbi:GTP cyclohydrolase II [Frigidibacter sp. ROC022]|uniref:GTP cyclohydrolase II n=1 Tax=Frigidibacter sp. ROC022 TaxID=2971796 RepID=UPI00215B3620|nr:GTP cyclohydrolase II [Frigidibacter sp. ROC022]MCR8724950.1 GTP cyclohydrolase II [Frigidibacter sp. ROC022]